MYHVMVFLKKIVKTYINKGKLKLIRLHKLMFKINGLKKEEDNPRK